MIDDDKWFFVSGTLDAMQKNSERFDNATDGLMIEPESPLVSCLSNSEHNLITALSFLIGDNFNTLNWFVYECDHGRKPMEAGVDGDMRMINSHDRLRWFLELSI